MSPDERSSTQGRRSDRSGATRVDALLTRFKNNPVGSIIVLAALALAAVAGVAGSLDKIRSFLRGNPRELTEHRVEITPALQPYRLMAGETKPSVALRPVGGYIREIDSIARVIADEMADTIQPQRIFATTLALAGHTLESDQPVDLELPNNAPAYVGLTPDMVGVKRRFDLTPFLPTAFSAPPWGGRFYLMISDPNGHFADYLLSIYGRREGLSFEIASMVTHKVVHFQMKKSRLLIEEFKGAGAEQEAVDQTKASLDYALRKELARYDFLEITPLTRPELEKERERIERLPFTPRKLEVVKQYEIDLVVTGRFLMNPPTHQR